MRLRRILSIILVILTLTMTVFSTACSSCFREETIEDFVETFESDGTLLYKKRSYQSKGGKKYFYVLGGQQSLELPKEVYIPAYFNGEKVTSYGVHWEKENINLYPFFNNVESLYLSYNTTIYEFQGTKYKYIREEKQSLGSFSNNGTKNLFLVKYYEGYGYWLVILGIYNSIECVYVSNLCFMSSKDQQTTDMPIATTDCSLMYEGRTSGYEFKFKVIRANTTYHFNYEESPNEDIFFINDFERGGKIENTPYEPIREGYKFKGWYKEPECVNAWDFEKDTLPAPEYYENVELKYVETCLYAKWEKN